MYSALGYWFRASEMSWRQTKIWRSVPRWFIFCTHTRSNTQTHTHIHNHFHTLTHTHPHTHAYTSARAHTHIYSKHDVILASSSSHLTIATHFHIHVCRSVFSSHRHWDKATSWAVLHPSSARWVRHTTSVSNLLFLQRPNSTWAAGLLLILCANRFHFRFLLLWLLPHLLWMHDLVTHRHTHA